MDYIEFGAKRDVIWVFNNDTSRMIAQGLKVRGFSGVTERVANTPELKSVWQEIRYLESPQADESVPTRPKTVYMMFRRTKPLSPEEVIAASTSSDITDMVKDALALAYPHWNIDVRPVGRPE
jgi:hypothetical protein